MTIAEDESECEGLVYLNYYEQVIERALLQMLHHRVILTDIELAILLRCGPCIFIAHNYFLICPLVTSSSIALIYTSIILIMFYGFEDHLILFSLSSSWSVHVKH